MSLLIGGIPALIDDAEAGAFAIQLELEKLVNGAEADTSPGVLVPASSQIVFTYTLHNFSCCLAPPSFTFPVLSISDDNGTPGIPGDDFSPVLSSGDDGNLLLDVGETWRFTATQTALPGLHENTVIVRLQTLSVVTQLSDVANYTGVVPAPTPLLLLLAGAALLACARRGYRASPRS